jgi:hypothetical protein
MVCAVEAGIEALQVYIDKRVASRTRQSAARLSTAADKVEPDPPKIERAKGGRGCR